MRQLSVLLDDATAEKLEREKGARGATTSEIVRTALRQHLGQSSPRSATPDDAERDRSTKKTR